MTALIMVACQTNNQQVMISDTTIQNSITAITTAHPEADTALVARGVKQVAALWQKSDGNEADFQALVTSSYAGTQAERHTLYNRLSHIIELCSQSADMLNNTLQEPTTLVGKGEPTTVDWIISGYSPISHFAEDMFANKIAHICILNFPHYTLDEKNQQGSQWTREQWAYARLGDMFHTRVPGSVTAAYAQALSQAENYIAGYNIMMHCLRNEQGERLWQEPMALLSHWNLRDELKSNYAEAKEPTPNPSLKGRELSRERQEMIYQVMLRIIRQEIPECVVNNEEYVWYPETNRLEARGERLEARGEKAPQKSADFSGTPQEAKGNKAKGERLEAKGEREPDTRYQQIINIFHALQAVDQYRHDAPSHVERTFNEDLQIPFEEIETLFTQLISSDEVKQVAAIIRERLGRDLRPYDIWYDGFKSRSTISEDYLTAQTQLRYPNAKAFERDMPRMLMDLGFAPQKAKEVASHIVVEAARGSGHARPCVGREQPARLRTRISEKGMDYKGYNIAVHEFGHNVEEVISLYNMDYYTLAGIPNTGFTEASAFLFQERDLELLGERLEAKGDKAKGERLEAKGNKAKGERLEAKGESIFDMIWGMYEIMGVSLVDMRMWQWLYAHPEATAADLREAVLAIAAEVWNAYYAPVLGEKDSPLLGIYSHMVGYALYLPAYPIGNLVQYQLEEHLAKCATPEEWAKEYTRIYQQGCLTPNAWMRGAVGNPMSVEPILKAVREQL